jgi:hypothetical protein
MAPPVVTKCLKNRLRNSKALAFAESVRSSAFQESEPIHILSNFGIALRAMARARLIELALPIVIYLALTLAVFALALWLLPL